MKETIEITLYILLSVAGILLIIAAESKWRDNEEEVTKKSKQ